MRGARVVLLAALLVVVGIALSPVIERNAQTQTAGVPRGPLLLSLAPPAFAQTSKSSFPWNEVGICAYVNMGVAVDLVKAKALLAAPEDATSAYVIGTIALTGSTEDMWPHVYVSSDGWLMAYYPAAEPTSKLFQWYGYTGGGVTTTTLQSTLVSLATSLHLDPSKVDTGITYYHFQYPEATRLLVAIDTGSGTDEFRYTIPSAIAVYDVAWTHHAEGVQTYPGTWDPNPSTSSSVDGATLYAGGGGSYSIYRSMEQQYVTANKAHTIQITQAGSAGWVGLAILFLYR